MFKKLYINYILIILCGVFIIPHVSFATLTNYNTALLDTLLESIDTDHNGAIDALPTSIISPDDLIGDSIDNTKIDGDLVSPATTGYIGVSSSGDGNPAAGTVTFTASVNSASTAVNCQDSDSCTMMMSEIGAIDGMRVRVFNHASSVANITFATSSGVQAVRAARTLAQGESIEFEYRTDYWDEVGESTEVYSASTHNHDASYELIQTEASQAEVEAGTEAAIRSLSPLRLFQSAGAWVAANGLKQNALTSEPANEQIGQIVYADSTWDPASVGQDAWVMCTVTGTPGTWIAIYGADGTFYIEIPLFTSTYASTDIIEVVDLYNAQLNNYGQSADATLTFSAAAAGMNAMFEVVDVSNALLFEPPSGASLIFVDSDGVVNAGSADQGVSCPAAGNTVGDELRITTYQTGASTYSYKIVQTIGDGCALQ